jgi:hypothetical protein
VRSNSPFSPKRGSKKRKEPTFEIFEVKAEPLRLNEPKNKTISYMFPKLKDKPIMNFLDRQKFMKEFAE